MNAREYTSPLIEKLLSEVTPEEMEKTEQLMEAMNNKQQTAVEWYAGRQHDLEGLRDFGAISIVEYYEELTKAVQQAKEMEKQQMWEYIKKNYCIGHRSLEFHRLEFEQYYNETYREGEQ
jgi:hypothetical protein